jgi:hypothetical protein
MSDTDDIRGLAEVSEAYGRAGFDELPPEEVDRAIRSAAARVTRRSVLAARLPRWTRPVAIAATAIIGVTALLRVNDISIISDEAVETRQDDRGAPTATEPSTGGAAVRSAPGTSNRATKFVVPDSDLPAERCDETAAANPESWLECIMTLRQQGSLEQAAREIEKLRARFRDFDLPPELDETQSR